MADPKQGLLELLMQFGTGKFTQTGDNTALGQATFELGDKESEILSLIQKFDKDAKWEKVAAAQQGEGGNINPEHYDLIFDQSKLPKNMLGQTQIGSSGTILNTEYLGAHGEDENWKKENLVKPEMVWFDENYGYQTLPQNHKFETGAMDQVFKFAPMIIASIATMGAGGALMAGLGGAITASGGSAIEAAIAQSMMAITQGGGLNFKSGGGILGALLGAAGVPGGAALGKILPLLLQLEQQRKSGGG